MELDGSFRIALKCIQLFFKEEYFMA